MIYFFEKYIFKLANNEDKVAKQYTDVRLHSGTRIAAGELRRPLQLGFKNIKRVINCNKTDI
jgi:hypothetical protein